MSDNLWNKSPQSWNAYGLRWEFTYNEWTAKRTITAPGFTLDVKITDINKFPSPYLWLEAWAKKNKNRLPKNEVIAQNLELDLFPSPEPKPEVVQAEVVTEELTEEEESDRLNLERKVERAFYEAGKALRELRDRKLYRSTHRSFEDYVKDRFGFGRSRSCRLIDTVSVVDNLTDNLKMLPNGQQILPTTERQVRPLTKLEPPQQTEAWTKAVETAGGKIPSGRIVKDIVQRIKEKTRVPNPYHVGEVCQIIAKDDLSLRGKGGYWCIISEVHEFSCTVKAWFGEITVRLSNLRLIDYSTADCEAMGKLCDRISQLYSDDMEEAARCTLAYLGKLDRPYLTGLEEKLLAVLEA